METTKRTVDRLLGAFLIALMGVSVVNVLWQVFTRFVLGAPSSFTEELARFLLIWIGVLGAGYAVGQRDHLALDLLPERLEGRAHAWVRVAIQACIAAFAVAVMIVGGLRLVYIQLTLGQTSAALDLPLGYVYLVLPVSGAVMAFYAAVHVGGPLRALRAAASAREGVRAGEDPRAGDGATGHPGRADATSQEVA